MQNRDKNPKELIYVQIHKLKHGITDQPASLTKSSGAGVDLCIVKNMICQIKLTWIHFTVLILDKGKCHTFLHSTVKMLCF